MDTNTHARRTSTSLRRSVPAVAIIALTIGLGACQTSSQRAAAPKSPVIQHAEVPAGVDMWRPADRIAAQLEYEASLRGVSADRMAERLHRVHAGMRIK